MAQDSIAYGESLLADVRKRNDKAERRERKDARRGEWKGLATKIGLSLVDDIFAQKQNTLLNSEEALKAKLGTTRALEFGTNYTTAETNAQKFEGGEEAYWASQAAPQVESYLQSQYQAGTYNKNAYNLYAQQLTNKYAQELRTQHKEGYNLTQKFFAAGGQEKDAYVNAVKKSQPATAFKGLSNLIGKSTGLLDADLHNNTSKLLESSKALIAYKDAYAQTKDSALSAFLAEEGLMDRVDLGAPKPEIGPPIKKINALGEEEIFFPYESTVNGEQTITLIGANNNGQFNFSSPQAQATTNQFESLASILESGKGAPFLNAGTDAIASLDKETNEELAKAVQKEVDLPVSSGLYKSTVERRNERIHAEAGAIIYTATKQEGWANTSDAKIIAAEMVSSAYINGNKQRALAGSGLKNPYHTMFAVNSAIDKGKINSFDSLAMLGSMDNVINMYNAYATETKSNRERIDALLEANNYFGDKVGGGDLFKQIHTTVKATFEKGDKGTDANLGRMYVNLYGNKKTEGSTVETETEEKPQVIDIASLPIPAGANERGIISANSRRQITAYKKLMELDKKIKARNEKIAYFSEEDTYNKGAIINISKALEKEQNRFNNLYANYINKYGSTEE